MFSFSAFLLMLRSESVWRRKVVIARQSGLKILGRDAARSEALLLLYLTVSVHNPIQNNRAYAVYILL